MTDLDGTTKKSDNSKSQVIDLVWIVHENVKRERCKMSGVLNFYHGSDERVRSALVEREDRNSREQ